MCGAVILRLTQPVACARLQDPGDLDYYYEYNCASYILLLCPASIAVAAASAFLVSVCALMSDKGPVHRTLGLARH